MQERYHIDLDEPGLLKRHSARWLQARIRGLIGVESRLHYALFPPEKPGGGSS